MSETTAYLALVATARARDTEAEREARIHALKRSTAPLRAPRVATKEEARQVGAVTVAPLVARGYLRKDEIRPGMRLVDGEWRYSAAWL